ncbi:MAG: hypothetical protein GY814_17735, partial [Gammaproteobacteria bacterium]|nr:hypothetical protein [Gammaproteobacteria bacterium]
MISGPIVSDAYGTQSAIDGNYPKIRRSDTDWFRLGVPAPVTAPTHFTIKPVDYQALEVVEQHYQYVYTYVDDFGQEGPNSPPSTLVGADFSTDTSFSVSIGNMSAHPTGNYSFDNGTIRIYRSGADGVFTFVAELNGFTEGSTYADSTPDDQLGLDTLQSNTWYGPPDDNTSLYPKGTLTSLEVMPNKFLAGGSG